VRVIAVATELTRVTLNLTPQTVAALDRVTDVTGDSRTDAMNKAVRLYGWFATAADHTGRVRFIRADGTEETVVLL
jgi:hypothetical protein